MAFIEVYNVETLTESSATLTDWINLLCVVTASGVAVYGINSWRRETTWKKKNELKEEVTTLLYELKDIIRDIRSPFSYVGEGESMKANKEQKHNNLAIVRERYDKNKELFAKLAAKKYRAMATFDKSVESHFIGVNKMINEIFISARRLDTQYYPKYGIEPQPPKDVFEKFIKEAEEHENIIWWQGEGDEHEKKINKVIDDFIETINNLK